MLTQICLRGIRNALALVLALVLALLVGLPVFAEEIGEAQAQAQLYLNPGRDLKIYQEASTRSPSGHILYQQQELLLLSQQGDWAQVQTWDEIGEPVMGFVKAKNLRPKTQKDEGGFAVLVPEEGKAKQRIPLYKGRNSKGTVLGKYQPGVRVLVLGVQKNWRKVRIGSLVGYVLKKNLEAPSDQAATLPLHTVQHPDTASLSYRAAPSYKAEKLGAVKNGQSVQLLGTGEEFAHVRLPGGGSAFMMASGLSPQPVFADIDTSAFQEKPAGGIPSVIENPEGEGAHLRARASSKADSMGLYRNGSQVLVIRGGTSWWKKVWVEGRVGYMMAKLIRGFEPGEGEVEPEGGSDYIEGISPWPGGS